MFFCLFVYISINKKKKKKKKKNNIFKNNLY
jgi:hypothetical protein